MFVMTMNLELELTTRTLIVHLWRTQIVEHGICPGFLSITEIAERICHSKKKTRKAMRELAAEGGIEERKQGRATCYRVIILDGDGNEYLSTREQRYGS